jgi:hypothetical protein
MREEKMEHPMHSLVPNSVLQAARERYWKRTKEEISAGVRENTFSEPDSEVKNLPPDGDEFITSNRSGNRLAFFEHDCLTGYLYVFDLSRSEVTHYLQVYTCAAKLGVRQSDVKVVWSADGAKCGVVIWGQMRGIIDIAQDVTGRASMSNRNSPGVNDKEWLSGFEGFDGGRQ